MLCAKVFELAVETKDAEVSRVEVRKAVDRVVRTLEYKCIRALLAGRHKGGCGGSRDCIAESVSPIGGMGAHEQDREAAFP